ncbi:hypothetical protein [Methanobrevibacter ruminantium]|nr:hypothetical protein [Methanobrevibacter ruminantium]
MRLENNENNEIMFRFDDSRINNLVRRYNKGELSDEELLNELDKI